MYFLCIFNIIQLKVLSYSPRTMSYLLINAEISHLYPLSERQTHSPNILDMYHRYKKSRPQVQKTQATTYRAVKQQTTQTFLFSPGALPVLISNLWSGPSCQNNLVCSATTCWYSTHSAFTQHSGSDRAVSGLWHERVTVINVNHLYNNTEPELASLRGQKSSNIAKKKAKLTTQVKSFPLVFMNYHIFLLWFPWAQYTIH